VQRQPRLAGSVDGVGDVQVVGEALGEVLPRMHDGVLRYVGLAPIRRWPELIVPSHLGLIVGGFVAEKSAALIEIAGRARTALDEGVLVVVADLVAEVAKCRVSKFVAKSHPKWRMIGEFATSLRQIAQSDVGARQSCSTDGAAGCNRYQLPHR
jgi:hypothetical protein